MAKKAKTKTKAAKAKPKAKAKAKPKAKATATATAKPKVKPAAKTAKAKAAPKRPVAPRKPPRAPTAPPAPPSWHTWDDRPDELEVLDHVEAFAQAVHAGDAPRAFSLCPIYTYREPLLVGDPDAVARAWLSIQDALVTWGYVDAGDASWFAQVTPPSRVAYQQLNLALPEDQGDALANVFVRDEVTDITSIFSLLEQGGRWQLAFKMFKVM